MVLMVHSVYEQKFVDRNEQLNYANRKGVNIMLAAYIALSLALTMPTQVKTVPVTIYATTESVEETEEVTVVTEKGSLYAFYSDADEWHKGEKADVTMLGDALVNIARK